MKKRLILFFIGILLIGFNSRAQTLETLDPMSSTYSTSSPIHPSMDVCNPGAEVTFRVRSARKAEEYLLGYNPTFGYHVWKIRCRLYDVTAGTTVASIILPLTGPGTGPTAEIRSGNATDLYTDLAAQQSLSLNNGVFQVAFDKHLEFTWTQWVADNHQYVAQFEIENYVSFLSNWINKTIVANEMTNPILVNGSFMQSVNTWNFSTIQYPFTDMGVGTIAGKLSGNNEGYLIGSDNRVYNVAWANNQWNIWCLDWNFTSAAQGGIAVNPTNNEVYFIGTDGRVYNGVWANNQWNIWCLDWNFTIAAPGAITVNPNNNQVYFVGTDGRVYSGVWANNQWNIWCLDWNVTNALPGAITVNPTNGEVYFIGNDNRIYNCVWSNNQWNVWCLDWNFTSAAWGAITVNPNNGQVYFFGTDGRVYSGVWANNQWNIWCLDWNFTTAASGAIVVSPISNRVFFMDNNHTLYNAVWLNNQWNFWPINGYVYNGYNSIGLMTKTVGNKHYEMIMTRSEEGRLQNHFWRTCTAEGESAFGEKNSLGQENTEQFPAAHSKRASNTGIPAHILNNDVQRGTEMTIQPNPVSDRAVVRYYLSGDNTVSIRLFDTKGSLVKEYCKGVKKTAGLQSLEITKDILPAGLYYLIMETTSGERQTQKVVIN